MKKILIINGSPRKNGNTNIVLKTFGEAFSAHHLGTEIEYIDTAKIGLHPCVACESCGKNGGNCVINDGTAALMNKVVEADALIFGTPVYWWGITAQLKTFIDKMYSKGGVFKKSPQKKIGLIAVGEAEIDDRQYELIKGQFECICKYLNWEFAFCQSVSATEAGEVSKQKETLVNTAAIAAKF